MGLLDEFSNFAQGASNAAAGNLSGPIDAVSWALKKIGLQPVIGDAPVGGSEWMARKGLTKPAQGVAGLLGESAGLALPIFAAAKAPQIASMINQGVSNYTNAAPMFAGPGNAQRGSVVWHGSPYKFDTFDASKIGTGEGAQAYGHGLYLADSPAVSESYINAGRSDLEKFNPTDEARSAFRKAYPSGRAQFGQLHGVSENSLATWLNSKGALGDEVRAAVPEELKAAYAGSERAGNLYKVDLPDEHIAKMLDWDKPLSQQVPEVQQLFPTTVEGKRPLMQQARSLRNQGNAAPTEAELAAFMRQASVVSARHNFLPEETGADVYRRLHNTLGGSFGGNANEASAEISSYLRQQGIPGIRYLDQGSRAAGQGSSNYVVFPGNEGLLNILERNGQPLK
jgi:hypothetical protein